MVGGVAAGCVVSSWRCTSASLARRRFGTVRALSGGCAGSGPGVGHDLELVLTSIDPVSNMRGHMLVRRLASTDEEPSNGHVEGLAATA
jgi:hypothetical protein